MKKLCSILLILCLLASMVACAQPVAETPVTVAPSAPVEETVETPVEEPAEEVVEEAPEEILAVEVTLYLPNENVDGFDEKTISLSALDGADLVAALVAEGIYSEDITLLSMTQDGDNLTLDMSQAFGTAASTTGTAGELMLIGSLVNTFLTAYDVETVTLLVEGNQLETGHTIYDFPLEFFANP